jgi:hypothetical protein
MSWPETQGSAVDSFSTAGDLLIEVWRLDEDHALDTHKHLQQRRFTGLPILLGRPRPGSQKRQTNLAAVVEVRVEPDFPAAGSTEVHRWGYIWILHRQEAIELEEPTRVWCVLRSSDHNLAIYSRTFSEWRGFVGGRGTYTTSFLTSSTRTQIPGGKAVPMTANSFRIYNLSFGIRVSFKLASTIFL